MVDGKWILRGGRIFDPSCAEACGDLDLILEGGKVAGFERRRNGKKGNSGYEVIDVSGMLVVPGLIDIHTHLREPGYEYKETVRSGSLAAVSGGFTTIICMANTNPPNDNRSVTDYILKRAGEAGLANVLPIGAVTKGLKGEELAEMGELFEAGVAGFSDDGKPVMDSQMMRHALEYSSAFGLTLISHPEDKNLTEGGSMNEGMISVILGLPGMPACAEDVMVARDIALAGLARDARLHFAHVSTRGSVELIRRAKKNNIAVTAEAAPHHLVLNEESVKGYNTNTKMNPPLRTPDDVEALREGLRDGTIDAIASDHAPHDIASKDLEYEKASFGIVGLETTLGLTLKLVNEGIVNIERAIELLTSGPARSLGLKKGTLKPGSDADVTVIDPEKKWTVDPLKFKSISKNTPFGGWQLKGKAKMTIVGGKVVFRDE